MKCFALLVDTNLKWQVPIYKRLTRLEWAAEPYTFRLSLTLLPCIISPSSMSSFIKANVSKLCPTWKFSWEFLCHFLCLSCPSLLSPSNQLSFLTQNLLIPTCWPFWCLQETPFSLIYFLTQPLFRTSGLCFYHAPVQFFICCFEVSIFLYNGPAHPEDHNLVPMEGMCLPSLIFLKASSTGIWAC